MKKNYIELLKKIECIVDKDLPLISNLSNVSSLIFKIDNLNWAGFYLVDGDYLFLGPFQGEIACTKIKKGKGVCGTSFETKETIIVDDVSQFPGHIACSNLSKSELVTPIIKDKKVVAVIDVDSPILNRFSLEEKSFFENISKILEGLF